MSSVGIVQESDACDCTLKARSMVYCGLKPGNGANAVGNPWSVESWNMTRSFTSSASVNFHRRAAEPP